VTKVSEVDEEGSWVYFQGWTETPLEQHLYRVPLEGGDVEQVTTAPGWHQAVLRPKAAHLIDTYSSLLTPPRFTCRRWVASA
jgi:dipeptidyl-peptidase-4